MTVNRQNINNNIDDKTGIKRLWSNKMSGSNITGEARNSSAKRPSAHAWNSRSVAVWLTARQDPTWREKVTLHTHTMQIISQRYKGANVETAFGAQFQSQM